MGFITQEDFDLLSEWGGKEYDKKDEKHTKARENLKSIYEKIEKIGKAIDESNFKIHKSLIQRNGRGKKSKFRKYNWGRFHPIKDERLCLTIGMDASKYGMDASQYYFIKIDTNDNSGLTDKERAAYETLRDQHRKKIVYGFEASEITKLDEKELIFRTKEHLDKLKKEWDWVYKELFGNNSPTLSKETTQNMKDTEKKLLPSLNIILYGPPGTGKTYKLQDKYFGKFTDKNIEQIIKEFTESKGITLEWLDAIALAMLDYETINNEGELTEHPAIKYKQQNSKTKTINASLRGELQAHTPLDCERVKFTNRYGSAIIWKNDDDTWKIDKELTKKERPKTYELWEQIKNYTPTVKERRYEFVTFHQSFSYEDFIEGIKPNLDDENSNELSYVIEEGVFLRLAKKAALNPDKDWALFIDEINRGNISNIFGELITLIEDDKREGADNELKAILPYSKIEFTVPQNLYIIATMNTADRSIEAIDTALRRRFTFIEVAPDPELLVDDKGEQKEIEGVNLVTLLTTINNRLLVLIGKDNLIGHSYFMQVKNLEDLQLVFSNKIIPLLEEYFYHDRKKIGMVLGEEFVEKSDETHKVAFHQEFSDEYSLDDIEIYKIKDPRELTPDAFRKIYDQS